MRYLLPLVIILTLFGCDNRSSVSGDNAKKPNAYATNYIDKPVIGRINQRGLYKLVRSGGIVNDPNTNTGKVIAKPVLQLVESTERIPLIKGAQMYLQYRIKPFPDRPVYVDLRQVLTHPSMSLPDGSVSTGSDIPFKGKVSVNQSIGYLGYGFDEDYELVEGEWIFEVWHQGKKLVEQTFITYWPDEEELAILKSRLAVSQKAQIPVTPAPTTPLAERDWPLEIEHTIGAAPDLEALAPLGKSTETDN